MEDQTLCPPITERIRHSEKDIEEALRMLGLLSNPLRLKIALLLSAQEMCTCHLEETLGAEQTLISHHLRLFKDLDLLHERRKGKWRFYSLKDSRVKDILKSAGLI